MIGYFGPLVFVISEEQCLFLKSLSTKAAARWATQDIVNGKPLSQYVGQALKTASIEVSFNAQYGVSPRASLEMLSQLAEAPYAHALVIGGKPVGNCLYKITDVSETWGKVFAHGELISATVSINLEEYV